MDSMQLHDIALYSDMYQPCILLSVHSYSVQTFELKTNQAIDEVKLHSNMWTSTLKVTKCIGVKPFVEALINMICELKITSGFKNNCVKIPWWSEILMNSY